MRPGGGRLAERSTWLVTRWAGREPTAGQGPAPLILLVTQVEYFSDGSDNWSAVGAAGLHTQLRDGSVSDLIDDAAGEHLPGFFLLG